MQAFSFSDAGLWGHPSPSVTAKPSHSAALGGVNYFSSFCSAFSASSHAWRFLFKHLLARQVRDIFVFLLNSLELCSGGSEALGNVLVLLSPVSEVGEVGPEQCLACDSLYPRTEMRSFRNPAEWPLAYTAFRSGWLEAALSPALWGTKPHSLQTFRAVLPSDSGADSGANPGAGHLVRTLTALSWSVEGGPLRVVGLLLPVVLSSSRPFLVTPGHLDLSGLSSHSPNSGPRLQLGALPCSRARSLSRQRVWEPQGWPRWVPSLGGEALP